MAVIFMGINFGYMRVSTKQQNLDRQEDALLPYVTDKKYIYSDKASGADFERDGFKNMLKAMRSGDTLYIKSLDRLSRNKVQIQEYLLYFKDNNIRVCILDIPTTMQDIPAGQEWLVEMVNNIIFEVISSIAQQERETIKQRQKEGIAVAKAKGKHLGRPILELPNEWEKYYKQWKKGEIQAVEFMAAVDFKKSTFYKKVKEYEATL